MKKKVLLSLTFILGFLASGSVHAQVKKADLTQIIESVNRKNNRMRYFRDKNTKLIVTRSDADVLSDGDISKVPNEKKIRDRHHQTLLFSGLKLNPYAINYTVIPDEMRHRITLKSNGIKMKSIYYVKDIMTGKYSFGIVADIGPGGQVTNGEFSVHQILDLNLHVDIRTGTGGKDANDIVTIIFPHSDEIIALNDIKRLIDEGLQGALQNRINEEGLKLLKKYSDLSKSKNLESIMDAIKAETKSVKVYD